MPHIHKLIDFTIAAVIVHEDRVLLVNHPRYNKWLTPGGHIELDEDPEQALHREIAEETGLKVEILSQAPTFSEPGHKCLPAPNFLDIHDANPPHRHIGLVYFAKAQNDQFVKSDEHDDMQWFSVEDLEKTKYNIPKAVKFYSKEAIKAFRD